MDAKALTRLRRVEPIAKRKPAIRTIPQPWRAVYQESYQHILRLKGADHRGRYDSGGIAA